MLWSLDGFCGLADDGVKVFKGVKGVHWLCEGSEIFQNCEADKKHDTVIR